MFCLFNRIVGISAGECQVAAVTQSGKLLTLQGGDSKKWVHAKELATERVQQISCGSNHTLVLCQSGKVYGFGNNSFLQLGRLLSLFLRFISFIGLLMFSLCNSHGRVQTSPGHHSVTEADSAPRVAAGRQACDSCVRRWGYLLPGG